MKAKALYLHQPKALWATVRTLSQQVGYTDKRTGQIKVLTIPELKAALDELDLAWDHIVSDQDELTAFGATLLGYFEHRAATLNTFVKSNLMDVSQAKGLFESLCASLSPSCPLPMNKQKGTKKAPAYFTGIINMLIQANSHGMSCDYDPRQLTTVTRDGKPIRTLARRVDGAFPSAVNPIAVWEIKEYYYTKTFGSRVADGVYETLLDGMELEELQQSEGIEVKHYLMIDDYFTWWECGRSYLCRILDMLHMGYVDEVLFGREVLDRVPDLVREWVKLTKRRSR
jgi:hypothetical protein